MGLARDTLGRQGQAERGSLAYVAFDRQGPTVALDDVARGGQPETHADSLALGHEANVEEPTKLIAWNAVTRVRDPDIHKITLSSDR